MKLLDMRNILDLNHKDAKKFFLSSEAYSNIELPPYFVFGEIVSAIDRHQAGVEIGEKELQSAKKQEDVNHILYGNKDGKYAWRKFEIINPLIYVSLVNIITEEANWRLVRARFKEFQVDDKIDCESIPVLPSKASKQKAAQIIQWVNNVEKKSVSLSLEYQFLYQTDIVNCYGAIYTHSIPWALHTKPVSKQHRSYDDLVGNKIDGHLQAMSHGQTNGIPQGSALMDFVAEMVLGYADSLLSDKLNENIPEKKYKILRYRDDYRIFVNDVSDGDFILKSLSEVLSGLGFRLNIDKTCFDEDVVGGSIKKDKSFALRFGAVPLKFSKQELLRQLLIVQQIGSRYPNSGSLTSRLSKILDVVTADDFRGQHKLLLSILVNIAYNNPKTYPYVAVLLARCIEGVPYANRKDLLSMIQNKICRLSNIGLLEIWTQRMALGFKHELNFNEKLCKNVHNKKEKIFESSWIKDKSVRKIIESNIHINQKEIKNIKSKIDKKEVLIFNTYNF